MVAYFMVFSEIEVSWRDRLVGRQKALGRLEMKE